MSVSKHLFWETGNFACWRYLACQETYLKHSSLEGNAFKTCSDTSPEVSCKRKVPFSMFLEENPSRKQSVAIYGLSKPFLSFLFIILLLCIFFFVGMSKRSL